MLAQFIIKRTLMIIPLIIAISVMVFIVMQLPPGDFLTTYIRQLEMGGQVVDMHEAEALRAQFGLDRPGYQQYLIWARNIVLRGSLGRSFTWDLPVTEVIGMRLVTTLVVSFLTLCFVWGVSIPIGIYSATHQYSKMDYLFTFIGFIGQAFPGFLIALILIYFTFVFTGVAVSGMNSAAFLTEPWGIPRVLDMLPRLLMLVVCIGLTGTAGMIRTVRAMTLDELGKQYVVTARAKGVEERTLIYKYPVRMAINPLISGIGATLAGLVSGETIVSIVFNMPTAGPMMFNALTEQDMFLAGGFLLIVSVFVVVGTLLSDILLSILDPRIRFGGVTES